MPTKGRHTYMQGGSSVYWRMPELEQLRPFRYVYLHLSMQEYVW